MARKKQTLIARGHLYARERVSPEPLFGSHVMQATERRALVARAWRDGYLAARFDARRKK